MSIINDALKKAGRKGESTQIFSKLDSLKTDAERFVLRRWLFLAGTGLVCVLGVILATNSLRKPADSSEQKSTVASVEQKTQPQALPLFSENSASLFSQGVSGFNLSGILYDQEKPLAIINERIVEEGALINGAKLLEIQPNSVRLSFKEKEFTLKIK